MLVSVSSANGGSDPPVPDSCVSLRLDEGEREHRDPATGAWVVLRGRLYGQGSLDQPRTVLERFRERGPEGVGGLEGSYLAVVHDPPSGVVAISDRLATRKGFYAIRSGSAVLSTDLADLADPWPGLSLAGVSSHLSSNGPHGGLTPLDGVEMVPPGSAVRLAPGRADVEVYYQWAFEPTDTRDRTILRDEMVDRMRSAVVDRLEAHSAATALLSLSGGFDSRGLLGFLAEHLGPSGVTAFTYHHGEAVGDMDRDTAARLAEIAGVRHRIVDGYRGDFLTVLDHNARRGLGLAHFCDEADVWRGLETDPEFRSADVLVVGDRQAHHFWLGRPLSTGEALSVVSVRPPSGIEWFLGLLPVDTAEGLRQGWTDRLTPIHERLERSGSWKAALMEAYFIERVGYTLNLWRERFGGATLPVVNPFLDMRLLEFVARLPWDLNDADRGLLHKEAIAAAFPCFEGVPPSSGGWNRPHWGVEMACHRPRIAAMIEDEPSPLDEVVPPALLMRLLERVESERPGLSEATSGLGWQVRKLVKRTPVARRLVRSRRRMEMADAPPVPNHEVLLRLLYVRRALAVLRNRDVRGEPPV